MKGLEFSNRTEYRGIRYAEASRFKAPKMIHYESDEIEGTIYGNKCYQYHWDPEEFYGKEFYTDLSYDVKESEDCLFLNITVPNEKEVEKPEGGYPVAVWYHGGAFCNGYGNEIEFSGEGYAKRGVILVTVNYRLNLFGFLCHPDFIVNDGMCGNYGIFDQMCALDWVIEHISMFGGDNKRISIFGQSAGSRSVETILSSTQIEGKIIGAWMMSGLSRRPGLTDIATMEKAADVTKAFFDSLGVTSEDLYTMPAKELYKFLNPLQESLGKENCRLGPVLDHYFMTETYKEHLDNNRFPNIRYMCSSCKDDIGMKDENGNPLSYTLTDAVKEVSNILSSQGKDTFAYFFKRDLPGDHAGAFHSSDLWYNFGTTHRAWRPFTEEDHKLSEDMMDANARFFKGEMPFEKYTVEEPFIKEWDI